MGITKLIPWLKKLAPDAFHTYASPDVPSVFVFDAAGGLHRALRSKGKRPAAVFFDIFASDLRAWLATITPIVKSGTDEVFDAVVVMDKKGHVSATKVEEQKRRREQLKAEVDKINETARASAAQRGVELKHDEIEPLPDDYVFSDAYDELGMRMLDRDQPQFDGLSILISKGGTDAILTYFDDCLRTIELPRNVRLWVDIREGHAYCRSVVENDAYGDPVWDCAPYEPEVIGEGEIATVYYAVRLAQARASNEFHRIFLRTDDTDVVPVLFSAQAHLPATTRNVHWLLRQGLPEWVDMFKVFEALRQLHFTPSKFVYYCAFRGCDHVDKSALSERVQEKKMDAAFQQLCAETAHTPTWDTADHVHLVTWHANPKLRKIESADKSVFASRGLAKVRRVEIPDRPRCRLTEKTVARVLALHAMWNPRWEDMRPIM